MSLDDLSDAPLTEPTLSTEDRQYLDYVMSLVDDPEVYGYAIDTLSGIAKSIASSCKVTRGQREAVRNIVNGAWEGMRTRERNRTSRRYEGFGR